MNQTDQPCVLIVQDEATALQIEDLCATMHYSAIATASGEAALTQAAARPPDLVITEIDLPGMNGYDLCRKFRANEATRRIPLLVLTSKGEVREKIAGFEAGADDYLAKPFVPEELAYRIKSLLARRDNHSEARGLPAKRGHVIALFGTKGGVGRTTIGVNLALELQRLTRGRTVLFDADFFFGDIALHLNVPPAHTILDLIGRMDQLDPELLDQVLVPHSSGARVLLSPRNPEDVETIQPVHIKKLLDALAAFYDYIVVDCQSIYDERTLTILEKADAILLVIKPEVGCVKNMAVFSELAVKLELPFDKKIHIVLNRSNTKSGIGAKDIERIFRRPIAFHVPSGGNAVVMSVNRGVPLVIEQPNHPFSVQVTQMARALAQALPVSKPATVPE